MGGQCETLATQSHLPPCHLTGSKLTYNEFGLAVLFPEAPEAFGDLPLKYQAGPTLFSL